MLIRLLDEDGLRLYKLMRPKMTEWWQGRGFWAIGIAVIICVVYIIIARFPYNLFTDFFIKTISIVLYIYTVSNIVSLIREYITTINVPDFNIQLRNHLIILLLFTKPAILFVICIRLFYSVWWLLAYVVFKLGLDKAMEFLVVMFYYLIQDVVIILLWVMWLSCLSNFFRRYLLLYLLPLYPVVIQSIRYYFFFSKFANDSLPLYDMLNIEIIIIFVLPLYWITSLLIWSGLILALKNQNRKAWTILVGLLVLFGVINIVSILIQHYVFNFQVHELIGAYYGPLAVMQAAPIWPHDIIDNCLHNQMISELPWMHKLALIMAQLIYWLLILYGTFKLMYHWLLSPVKTIEETPAKGTGT